MGWGGADGGREGRGRCGGSKDVWWGGVLGLIVQTAGERAGVRIIGGSACTVIEDRKSVV